jgi:nicotinamidase-related amidase
MIAPVWYYQQFDADLERDVPAEGYSGWRQTEIDIGRTALLVMHAWEMGTTTQYPGWHRAVEYIPRAQAICQKVFPPLLAAARSAGMPVFHVVGGGDYYRHLPGFQRAVALTVENEPSPIRAIADPLHAQLCRFRSEQVFVGKQNEVDVARGFARLDFPPEARPRDVEGIAENAAQLTALCNEQRINHLIYIGFALNWCLLMSPGGMLDMSRRGFLCSTVRQATTAVENRETARAEANKAEALWRIALAFGFVFDDHALLTAMEKEHKP